MLLNIAWHCKTTFFMIWNNSVKENKVEIIKHNLFIKLTCANKHMFE